MRTLYLSGLMALLALPSCNQPTEFQRSSTNPQITTVEPQETVPGESSTTPVPVPVEEEQDQLPPPVIEPGQLYQRLFLTTEVDSVQDRFLADRKFSGVSIPIRENQRQETVQLPLTDSHRENIRHEFNRKVEKFQEKIQPLPLDLVLVVDDSSSMQLAVENIKKNLIRIVDKLGDTHWRIAVTTTSIYIPPRRGNHRQEVPCILGVLDRFDNGNEKDFQDLVSKIGLKGHDDERGLERSIRALSCDYKGKKWTRDNAMLGIVVVSDEDDCTSTQSPRDQVIDCNGSREQDISFKKFEEKLRGHTSKYYNSKFYALTAVPGTKKDNRYQIQDACWQKNPYGPKPQQRIYFTPGFAYEKAVKLTEGLMACIWEKSYDDIFSRISSDLISSVKKRFPLKHIPIREGLVVKIDGVDVTKEVAIKGNVLSLDRTPQVGQTIDVEYTYLSTDPLKEHQLSTAPLLNSVTITLDGRKMRKGEYKINRKGRITFLTDVPAGSTVGIDFKSVRNRVYTRMNAKADISSVQAFQGRRPFKHFSIDPGSHTLSIDLKKVKGRFDPVIVKYNVTEGTVLHYAIDRGRLQGQFKGVFRDLEMQEPVDGAKLLGTFIILMNGSVEVDDTVQAMFESSVQKDTYPLTFLPVLGRKIEVKIPDHCPEGSAVVDGQQLKVSCTLNLEDAIEVNYTKLVAKKTVFDFEQVKNPEECTWKVTLDGSDTPLEFLREGTTIFINEELPVDARIKITARVNPRPAGE